ncbi:acyltransferase family domain-containing protein [Ditylenchus destructor]|nr:acyltransferase family domain-containing protein [Ditylenchus destructor]
MCSIASITSAKIIEPALMIRMEDACQDLSSRILHVGSALGHGNIDYVSLANSTLKVIVQAAMTGVERSWADLYLTFSIAIILFWLGLVIYGTFSADKSSWNILSLKTSLAELCDMRNRGSRLDVLDVFRVVAIVWVVANHLGSEGRVDILDRLPSAQQFKSAVHNHPIFGALLGNSALGVEIFLVLSGLLAARSWSRKADTKFEGHYIPFMLHRWFRLTPVVAAFVFLATGPIMKLALPKFHTTMVSTCGVKGILSHLTLTGNLQSTPTCLGYLWYLGLDMQLYLMAPFLLHFMYKKPRMALALIAFLISFSATLRAIYCQVYGVCNKSDVDIPFISYPGQTPEMLAEIYAGLWEMYSRPYTKCGPFLIGLFVGKITTLDFEHVQGLLKFTPGRARGLLYFGFGLAMATIYAILPEYWWPNQGNTLYNTLYSALFRTAFAGAVSIMILALYFNPEKTHIGRYWAIIAKLTFNAYLIHMPVVYLFNFVPAFQEAETVFALFAALPFALSISFALAFVFYMFVESPFARISARVVRQISA